MVAITIGAKTDKYVIHDNAVLANSTNFWGIKTGSATNNDPLGNIFQSSIAVESSIITKAFSLVGNIWRISGIRLSTTDYDTVKGFVDTYESNDNLLYLTITNEDGTNLATKGSNAAPATQTIFKGKLGFLIVNEILSRGVVVSTSMVYATG